MTSLKDIFEFTEMLHQFQQVRRRIWVRGEDRRENDWEHSFHTAITAWYVCNSREDIDLDENRVIKCALAHDLVEVHAGDTPFQEADEQKEKREKEAAKQLQKEFPEFQDLHKSIEAYKNQSTPEAQFVYALDKIIPFFNVYLNDGRSFKTDDVDLAELREHKKDKFDNNPKIEEYYEELMNIFANEESQLFGTD
jgi:putative hydrolase of HD superfamily